MGIRLHVLAIFGVVTWASCAADPVTRQEVGNADDEPAVDGQTLAKVADVASAPAGSPFEGMKWNLADVGGGGAISALAVGPITRDASKSTISFGDSPVLLLGSDVGGVRISTNGGKSYFRIAKGWPSEINGTMPVQQIHIAPGHTGAASFAAATTTRGDLLVAKIDVKRPWNTRWSVVDGTVGFGPLGAFAFDRDGKTALFGTGNLNAVRRGETFELDPRTDAKFGQSLFFADFANPSAVVVKRFDLISQSPGFDNRCGITAKTIVTDVALPMFSDDGDPSFWFTTQDGGPYRFARESDGTFVCVNKTPPEFQGKAVLGLAFGQRRNDLAVLVRDKATSRSWVARTTTLTSPTPSWSKISPVISNAAKQPFLMRRSINDPDEIYLSGSKSPKNTLGVYCTFNARSVEPAWGNCMDPKLPATTQGWTRFADPGANQGLGSSEMALVENGSGTSQLYFAGMLGMFFKGNRNGTSFDFAQKYTVARGGNPKVWSGTGLSLMVPRGVHFTPRSPDMYFAYDDNVFFDSQDGKRFHHPIPIWGRTLGMAFDGPRRYVAFDEGQFEFARNGTRLNGGILRADVNGWTQGPWAGGASELRGLKRGAVTGIAMHHGQIAATLFQTYEKQENGPKEQGLYLGTDAKPFALHTLKGFPLIGLTATTGAGNESILLAHTEKEVYAVKAPIDGAGFSQRMVLSGRGTISRVRAFGKHVYVVTTTGLYHAVDVDAQAFQAVAVPSGVKVLNVSRCQPAGGDPLLLAATKSHALMYRTDGASPGGWATMPVTGFAGWKNFEYVDADDTCKRIYAGSSGAFGTFRLDPP